MQRIGMVLLSGALAMVLGACTNALPGGMTSSEHQDHAVMDGTPTTAMDHSNMMTDTAVMTDTTMMSETQMSGMDHPMATMDPSQPFDAQFIDSMIEHHQGAIEMAQQALADAEHEELRTLANAIIAAQTQEIAEMTTWRQGWYPDLATTNGMGMDMGEMTISTDDSKTFDQRFLEAMISHHQGAIEMAQMAQDMAEHTEIKTLADAIIQAQQTEISQMQAWLKDWFGE